MGSGRKDGERVGCEEAIGAIYDAALGARTWRQALEVIRCCVWADAAFLCTRGTGTGIVVQAFVGSSDNSGEHAEGDGFCHGDPVGGIFVRRRGMSGIQFDIPSGALSAWRAGCGYACPDDRHHLLGGPLVCRDDIEVIIGLGRDRESPAFGNVELARARRLVPHVARALTLADRMEHARLLARLLDATPGMEVPGLLLFDRDGRVLFLNRMAEDMLARQQALTLRDGRLRTPSRRQQQWLDAVTVAEHRDTQCAGWQGSSARFTAFDGSGDLALSVLPWSGIAEIPGSAVAGAVTVGVLTSLDGREIHSVPLIQSLFGLTVGEARLMEALASTGSLAGAAQKLDIQVSTARDRLKAVFRKTGFNSQSSVVAAVLRSPTRQPPEDPEAGHPATGND